MAVIAPRRDGRAYAFVAVVVLVIILAIAAGRPALAAFAAPFVVALLLGLRVRSSLDISATLQPSVTTCLEGDEFDATLTLRCRADLHVSARVVDGIGIGHAAGSPVQFHLEPGQRTATVRLEAREWGRQSSGTIVASAWLPGGLIVWEGEVGAGERVRVLPAPIRLRQLLDPSHARVIAGVHPSRAIAEGIDFAEIRPYAPGDRLRNLNRRATARRGSPHVNRFHPERSGDVVLLIDTFGDSVAGRPSSLNRAAIARAARASWALAQVHLAAQDRVGFLSYGRVGSWLPPGGGDRARYRLLSSLLELGGDVADGTLRWGLHPERAVPTNALVVAFTPLWKAHSLGPLHALRRAGCNVVAVVIDTSDLVTTGDEHDELARRIWDLQLTERRRNLANGGVPEVLWPAGADVGQSIARLRHVSRAVRR
jgi:uncharacterized protein (DUF58 family)